MPSAGFDRHGGPGRDGARPQVVACDPADGAEQRHDDRHGTDETVAKLDERVRVLRRQRMPLLTARPVAAAQARVGKPHGSPGADDEPQRTELREHERKDLRGSEDERPQPSERRGLGVHGFESIQRGSRIDG